MKRLAFIVAVLVSLALPAGAAANTWPTWGNNEIADCTFAAAANWEIAAMGHDPDEAQVEQEFYEAGGSAEGGISPIRFAHYWAQDGIGGVRASVHEVRRYNLWDLSTPSQARRQLAPLLSRAHYLLAELVWEFGHEVLVVGANPIGVTIVTYGEEDTIPWAEWYESVVAAYVVTPLS